MKSPFKTATQVEFADLMCELKKRFGYTQTMVAKVCKMSSSMVSQILDGERSPNPARLELLRLKYKALTEPAGAALLDGPPPPDLAKALEQAEAVVAHLKRSISYGQPAPGLPGIGGIAVEIGKKGVAKIQAKRSKAAKPSARSSGPGQHDPPGKADGQVNGGRDLGRDGA